jgi:hypothetical protein
VTERPEAEGAPPEVVVAVERREVRADGRDEVVVDLLADAVGEEGHRAGGGISPDACLGDVLIHASRVEAGDGVPMPVEGAVEGSVGALAHRAVGALQELREARLA